MIGRKLRPSAESEEELRECLRMLRRFTARAFAGPIVAAACASVYCWQGDLPLTLVALLMWGVWVRQGVVDLRWVEAQRQELAQIRRRIEWKMKVGGLD